MANEAIEKVELKPIEAVKVSHHRSLPPGRYMSYRGWKNFYFLARVTDPPGTLYLVEWGGKGQMITDFEVTPEGTVDQFVWDDAPGG